MTDIVQNKQWQSTPKGAGHRKDFYRLVQSPNLDPLVYEKLLSEIESESAPVLRELDQTLSDPSPDQLNVLLLFIASQWIRTPAFRRWIIQVADSIHRASLEDALSTRETWKLEMQNAGLSYQYSSEGYEGMKELLNKHAYVLSAENDWYLYRGFKNLEALVSSLGTRHWRCFFSENGNFVASDNPIVMDGPQGQMIGFKSADVVLFTVSRHVLLCGALAPFRSGPLSRREIARHNTFTLLNASSHVYSHVHNFCWLDEDNLYRTDWRLFSKQKFGEKGIKRMPGPF